MRSDVARSFASLALGVLHAVRFAASVNVTPGECVAVLASGVGHQPQPLALMECADARSRQRRGLGERAGPGSGQSTRPDGVVLFFQVSANTIEPAVSNRCFNLFTKDDWRAALRNELAPDRPKVARIVPASLGAVSRERLTGPTPGPDLSVVRPASEPERVGPPADAGEEVTLPESSEVVGGNKLD